MDEAERKRQERRAQVKADDEAAAAGPVVAPAEEPCSHNPQVQDLVAFCKALETQVAAYGEQQVLQPHCGKPVMHLIDASEAQIKALLPNLDTTPADVALLVRLTASLWTILTAHIGIIDVLMKREIPAEPSRLFTPGGRRGR